MAVYAENAALALRLIAEKGAALTFRRYEMADFDPVTGGTGTTGLVSSPAVAVILPVGKSDASRMSDRLLEALTQGRLRKLLLAPKDMLFEVAVNDFTEFEGGNWKVAGLSMLKPDGVTAIIGTLFVEQINLSDEQAEAMDVPVYEEAVDDLSEVTQLT